MKYLSKVHQKHINYFFAIELNFVTKVKISQIFE